MTFYAVALTHYRQDGDKHHQHTQHIQCQNRLEAVDLERALNRVANHQAAIAVQVLTTTGKIVWVREDIFDKTSAMLTDAA